MTRARSELIFPEITPYYHCISRCVRRAFLWGEDHLTGHNYSHRKQWVVDRLEELVGIFAIDLCAYAVMSNHYHLVVRIHAQQAQAWSDQEVIKRWQKLHHISTLVQQFNQGQKQTQAEKHKAQEIIEQWRQRLMDLSWFMRELNEHLARRANQEDQCTGRFWEGRFKSQALLDEAAVLTCMSYVDLNPIRAGIADTPEQSDYTSIQQRIASYRYKLGVRKTAKQGSAPRLMPLVRQGKDPHANSLGFITRDYLELIDWAGRAIRQDAGKRGHIPGYIPPILERLGLAPDRYLDHLRGAAKTEEPIIIGQIDRMRQMAHLIGQRFVKGVSEARRLYASPSL